MNREDPNFANYIVRLPAGDIPGANYVKEFGSTIVKSKARRFTWDDAITYCDKNPGCCFESYE